MAVEKRRYTFNAAVSANTVPLIATIEGLPVSSNIALDVKPLGIRLKLDITQSSGGVSRAFSGELFLVIGYYYDSNTDSIIMDITPEGKTLEQYNIVDAQDLASWFHLFYPDDLAWIDYIKVLISAVSPDAGQTATFYIDVNSPNVNTKILAETFTWQLI